MIAHGALPFRTFLFWLFAVLLLLVSSAVAQDPGIDSPHIAPHANAKISSYVPASAALPTLTSRPMRVDVDLVLVPVTVVDSMSRPVIQATTCSLALLN